MTDVSAGILQDELGDRYAVERELGPGGMGVVYLARDLELDQLVARKVLPAEFAATCSSPRRCAHIFARLASSPHTWMRFPFR